MPFDTKVPKESPTCTGTVGGITKSMVGLANVDNTTDTSQSQVLRNMPLLQRLLKKA